MHGHVHLMCWSKVYCSWRNALTVYYSMRNNDNMGVQQYLHATHEDLNSLGCGKFQQNEMYLHDRSKKKKGKEKSSLKGIDRWVVAAFSHYLCSSVFLVKLTLKEIRQLLSTSVQWYKYRQWLNFPPHISLCAQIQFLITVPHMVLGLISEGSSASLLLTSLKEQNTTLNPKMRKILQRTRKQLNGINPLPKLFFERFP